MATKKDQTDEEILKELHAEDNDSSNSDEDVGIDLAKMKAQSQKKASAEKDKKPSSDPISEEKKRHKENLMQDIYD